MSAHASASVSGPPAVSVVMSVYNGERFLCEAVESILAQTCAELELIVLDDGSTDATGRILFDYASGDSRVVVDRQSRQGLATALNRGFALAQAQFVARIDADDASPPSRLECQRRFLVDHPEVAVVGGAVRFVDESGRPFADYRHPLSDAEIRSALDHTTPFVHSGVMLRKEAFDRVGGYRPVFREAEDLDLWLRIAEQHELANLPDIVVSYRMHPGQATVRRLELQTLCAVAARAAARARAAGRPDPFDGTPRIDHQLLLSHGVSREEVTAGLVHTATWLAKTMGRAGYENAQEQLFAEAGVRARSSSGSRALVAEVYRQRARRYYEQGRRVSARVMTARAALAAHVG